MKIDDIPKMVLTQDALKASGKTIKARGVLEGDACKSKRIRIDAMEKGNGNPPVKLMAAYLVQDIGPFEMLLPKGDGPVWIMASCDVNGDGFITPKVDYTGGYAKNPITPSGDVADVNITLGKDPVPMGTLFSAPAKTATPPAAGAPPAGAAGAVPAGAPPAGAAGAVPAGAPPAGATGAPPPPAAGSAPGSASKPAGATPAPAPASTSKAAATPAPAPASTSKTAATPAPAPASTSRTAATPAPAPASAPKTGSSGTR